MLSSRQRPAREEGFTLIELLVVLIIIGVLLAIAIPSYLGFQRSAQQTAAASDVRQAIPDVEAYYADHNTYTGMSAAELKTDYDSGLSVVGGTVTVGITNAVASADGKSYCISGVDAGNYADVAGPGGVVQTKKTTDYCAGAWTAPTS